MAKPVELLIEDAWLVATMDDQRRELAGGWVAIDDGFVVGVGSDADDKTVIDRDPSPRQLSSLIIHRGNKPGVLDEELNRLSHPRQFVIIASPLS